MNFTYGNHLNYTIGDRLFGYRETIYEKYKVYVGPVDKDHYKKSNWVEEQYRTADLIYKDYGKDFVVMFSGGTDSEIVLRAFKKIGVTPRVVFIRFAGGHNANDAQIARHVASQIGFELEEIEFDIVNYYKSGQAMEFATEINCRQMAYLSVYHHIAKLGLPAVMGGEMLMRRHVTPTNSKWYYCFRENEDASAMRFSIKYNLPLVNEWFSYTPEMLGYYLERPEIKWLFDKKDTNGKLGSVTIKNTVLQKLMPEIIKKRKTHGFESLMGFNGETYEYLYKNHVKRLEPSLDGIFIDDLKKQLFGDSNGSD